MDELLAGMRAIAETTRLRLLFVLSHGEFNVSELTQILGQSQPRVSRHLKLMTEAGLLSRYKEGSWVLFRLSDEPPGAALARAIVDLLPGTDPVLISDIARLQEIRRQRAEAAASYFRTNAANWERLRSLHVSESDVEAAMLDIAGMGALGSFLDLGTGTGRILSLFADRAAQAIGIDQSREMLGVARANLEAASLRQAQVRQGDIYALPFPNAAADFVTIHQVLHYLDDPGRALTEAARVLKPGGRLLIVDFAPHDLEHLRDQHAHRRLGIASDVMASWLRRADLQLVRERTLAPPKGNGSAGLTVSLWLAERRADNVVNTKQTVNTRVEGNLA
ncbi:metalloregulator ArsR/SmtB family transcription factor [Nordella sp. HKS 07]|uniref:ArsR/SmtB family transcription factor n=1 Tax=Nordella sp. HKS 07 TaxID=2712222 RepID=UPI001FED466B|nr:metalloregulator ArsR/SmtB family transcription factor [Nordella sp. HKS 07]